MQIHFPGKERSKRSSRKIKNSAQRSQLEELLGCRQRCRPVPPLPTAHLSLRIERQGLKAKKTKSKRAGPRQPKVSEATGRNSCAELA